MVARFGALPFSRSIEMPIRTSKTEHEYPYGHLRRVGEQFHVDQSDVDVLLALGRIDAEPDEQGYVPGSNADPARSAYATRDMTGARATGSRRNRKAA
jgi:hypothetical protein